MQGIKGSFNEILAGHRSGTKKNKNISTNAVELYKAAAESGHADAQYEYGMCLNDGNGIEKDEAEAVKWFQKAADNGNIDAKFCMAMAYLSGESVEQDTYRAVALLRECRAENHIYGTWIYGICLLNGQGVARNQKDAFLCFQNASEKGCYEATEYLADMYYCGTGVEKNIEKAKDLFSITANRDFPESQGCLGHIYYDQKNYSEAEKWFLKGAQNGDGMSMFNIATMYLEGTAGGKNYDKGLYWSKKACSKNVENAEFLLYNLYKELGYADDRKTDIIDFLKSLKDANKGRALYSLAHIFLYEKKDKDIVIGYIEKAAAAGCEEARKALEEFRDEKIDRRADKRKYGNNSSSNSSDGSDVPWKSIFIVIFFTAILGPLGFFGSCLYLYFSSKDK